MFMVGVKNCRDYQPLRETVYLCSREVSKFIRSFDVQGFKTV